MMKDRHKDKRDRHRPGYVRPRRSVVAKKRATPRPKVVKFIAWDGEGVSDKNEKFDYYEVYESDYDKFMDIYGDLIDYVKHVKIKRSQDYDAADWNMIRSFVSSKGLSYDEIVGEITSRFGYILGTDPTFDDLLEILTRYKSLKSEFESRKRDTVDVEYQKYVLLASSEGDLFEDWQNGLHGEEFVRTVFDKFMEYARAGAIQVFFGATYDFTMILRNLPYENVYELKSTGTTVWNGYEVGYVRGKFLRLIKDGHKAMIYDVLGFFQKSFVTVLKTFLDIKEDEVEEVNEIASNKTIRSSFNEQMRDQIVYYNNLELKYLVKVMNRLYEIIQKEGLRLQMYTGAGALAESYLGKHKALLSYKTFHGRQSKFLAPTEVLEAGRYAYYGGRAELFKTGLMKNVYNYDINSAYPYYITQLPSLYKSSWVHVVGPWDGREVDIDDIKEFSLYKVRWNYPNAIVGGFPYRSKYYSTIVFPDAGIGWYWGIELKANLRYIQLYPKFNLQILEAYEFHTDNTNKPFEWVSAMYAKRQEYKRLEHETGVHYAQGDVMKLGMNSIYGKFAQRVTASRKTPRFHNVLYAGFITSGCRAQILNLIVDRPDKVVSIATDGLFILEPVEECESHLSTNLGEYDKSVSDEALFLQAGFYFYRKGDTWYSKTRGVIRSHFTVEHILKTIEEFKLGKEEFVYPIHKFVTISQLNSRNYDKIGSWVSGSVKHADGKVVTLMGDDKRVWDEVWHDYCYSSVAVHNEFPDEMGHPPSFKWGVDDEGLSGKYDDEYEQFLIQMEYYDD